VEETGDDYHGSYGDYVSREGSAALRVDSTGDSIFVSDVMVDYLIVTNFGTLDFESYLGFGRELVFDDQTISTDEDFFNFFGLDTISASTIPASFTSAPDDFESARGGTELLAVENSDHLLLDSGAIDLAGVTSTEMHADDFQFV
jgi:hypothetical protein